MGTHSRHSSRGTRRVEHVGVVLVTLVLLAGVGMLGWLAGHVGTYDLLARTLGSEPASATTASHGYLALVEHAGFLTTMLGSVLAALLLVAASPSLALRLRSALGSSTATSAALIVPTIAFVVIEHAEGSVASAGVLLLLVGMPLQGLLGLAVLHAVRLLLRVLADVVEQLVLEAPRLLPRAPAAQRLVASGILIGTRRRPTATCAPRRGPPMLVP